VRWPAFRLCWMRFAAGHRNSGEAVRLPVFSHAFAIRSKTGGRIDIRDLLCKFRDVGSAVLPAATSIASDLRKAQIAARPPNMTNRSTLAAALSGAGPLLRSIGLTVLFYHSLRGWH